jgi:alpha-glucosidase (family GH31 glycosyl hydrolase)
MGFTGSDIGGLQNNLQVIYARWIQLGFFHPFVGHTLQGSWRSGTMGI